MNPLRAVGTNHAARRRIAALLDAAHVMQRELRRAKENPAREPVAVAAVDHVDKLIADLDRAKVHAR